MAVQELQAFEERGEQQTAEVGGEEESSNGCQRGGRSGGEV